MTSATRATAASDTTGVVTSGPTPRSPANRCQVQRPMSSPAGIPMAIPTVMVVTACQRTLLATCRRVKPMAR